MVNKNDLIEIIRSSDWSIDTMSETTAVSTIGIRPKNGRDGISNQIREIASKVTPQYGIELIDVIIKRVNYIDSVRLKVYDRMISERKRIAAEKRSTGEGQKAEILGTVERKLKEIISTANREAVTIKGKADAEATKIYGEAYSQDPDFYGFQKTLESYPVIIGDNTSLVLSSDSDLYRFLKSVERKLKRKQPLFGGLVVIQATTRSRIRRSMAFLVRDSSLGFKQINEFLQLLLVCDIICFKLLKTTVTIAQLSLTPGTDLNRTSQKMAISFRYAAYGADLLFRLDIFLQDRRPTDRA